LFVATLAFDQSQAAARTGGGRAALHALDRAVTLDPGNALYWRERGLYRASLNRPGASDDLRRALALVPGDTSAMRGLAVIATRQGNSQLALAAARRAAELRPIHAENLATLAWALLEAGESDSAQQTLVELLRRVPWIAASDAWASVFPVGDGLADLQDAARGAWGQHSVSARTAMSLVWASAAVDGPDVLAPNGWTGVPYLLAVDRLLRCNVEAAQAAVEEGRGAAGSNLELRVTIMVARVAGDEAAVTEAVALADLWGITDGRLAVGSPPPHSPVWDPDDDRRIYHRAAVVPVNLELVLPTSADGLSAWLRDPLEAARTGAPSSILASCHR
jgi:tetratricopeptide (TPR) repeat protein